MVKLNKCIKRRVLDIIKTKEKRKKSSCSSWLVVVVMPSSGRRTGAGPSQEGPAGAISSPERVDRKSGDWQQLDKIKE
jgi:hypothetical protein